MAKIDAFFKLTYEQKASYLYLSSGSQPMLKIRGAVERVKYDVLKESFLRDLLYEILPDQKRKRFEETGRVRIVYEVQDVGRYRGFIYTTANGISSSFKAIPLSPLSAEASGLPSAITELTKLQNGLVIIAGPKDSGKTATIASMLYAINRTRSRHIVTIEDQIEYIYESNSCLIDQLETGRDFNYLNQILKQISHRDVDIIYLSEMNDPSVIKSAFEAVLSGRLVLTTMNTRSSLEAVERIISLYPDGSGYQIRNDLADFLKAVISQESFARIDMNAKCFAFEILIGTPAVRAMIKENKLHSLVAMLQTGKKYGMQLMDNSIKNLFDKGWISAEDAYMKTNDKNRFRQYLVKPPADFTMA